MQFQVPQFIEVEDKVFGPFTIRQFIYIAGGAGLSFMMYRLLPGFVSIVTIPIIAVLSGMLAFYKYNSRPFVEFVESFFKYSTSGRLYIWKKEIKAPQKQTTPTKQNPQNTPTVFVPKLSESKLKELSWNLDIRESQNPITGGRDQTNT